MLNGTDWVSMSLCMSVPTYRYYSTATGRKLLRGLKAQFLPLRVHTNLGHSIQADTQEGDAFDDILAVSR